MPLSKDDKRPIRINTPLGTNKMHVITLEGTEAVNQPYEFTAEVACTEIDLDPKDLLGLIVSISIEPFVATGSSEQEQRTINAVVNQITVGDLIDKDVRRYVLHLVAPFFLLHYSSHCRIYQEKTAKDIIQDVLDERQIPYEFNTTGNGEARPYCVQYRETDFAYVQRLIEFEGWHYYFKPTEGGDVMVITDGFSAYEAHKGVTYDPFNAQRSVGLADSREGTYRLASGEVTLSDWNWQDVKVVKGTETSADLPYQGVPGFTQHDHAQHIGNDNVAKTLATVRVDSSAGNHADTDLRTHYPTMRPGLTLEVDNWDYAPHKGQKIAILAVRHSLSAPLTNYSGFGGDFHYSNIAGGVDSAKPWRPRMTVARPVVHGPQTAIVVGPKGQEIHTDEHGRVKVQMHWDLLGKGNDESSCWIRVQQSWAGPGFGFQFIPRINMEVVVVFIEGDPDRPLITGCVYNGNNPYPYQLPNNKTQSGIKTRSSKEGKPDNCNEIRFEDLKGQEELFIQAEKNYVRKVKNNEYAYIGNNRYVQVWKDHTRHVKKGNEEVVIEEGDRTFTVKKGDETHEISEGDQNVIVGKGDQLITVGEGDQKTKIEKGNQATEVSQGDQTTEVKMGDITIKAGMGSISMEAMKAIEFKVGQSTVTIDQFGISMQGAIVEVTAQAMLNTKGAMVTHKADAIMTIQGTLVKIN